VIKILVYLVLAAAIAIGLPLVLAPLAKATDSFTTPVTSGAEQWKVMRSKQITVKPNAPVYLAADRMDTYVSSWGSGKPTNVGTTTRITCVDVNNAKNRIDPHYGVNIVRGEHISPAVRTMLTKPGTYKCELKIRAYSTATAPGMKVTVKGDARLNTSVRAAGSTTWSDETDSGLRPRSGTTQLSKDFPTTAGRKVTLATDFQVSNCNSGDATRVPAVCAGGSTGAAGNKFRVYASLIPLKNGKVNGPEVRDNRDAVVSNGKHHLTMLSAVSQTMPCGTDAVRAHVGVYMFDGDKGWLHGPYHYSRATILR
jgi:hypothetical protein